MAVVPVTINGVAFPKHKDAASQPFPVTIVGYAWITGLKPDIDPPSDAHPEHPIVIIPPTEPGQPPTIWGPGDPRPTLPIAGWDPGSGTFPEPPPESTLDEMLTMVAKAPPAAGGWGWFPEYGWVYSPGPGSAQPKTPRR